MKLSTVVLFILLAACGRANDLPALKQEATGLVESYQARFDDLKKRSDAILQRGNAIGVTSPDARLASQRFAVSKGRLDQLNSELAGAKTEIDAAKDPMELRRWIDRTKKKLQDGFVEINADFDAVESWLTLAEERQQQVSSSRRSTPPPVVPPPPGNPGQLGAGGTAPAPVQ